LTEAHSLHVAARRTDECDVCLQRYRSLIHQIQDRSSCCCCRLVSSTCGLFLCLRRSDLIDRLADFVLRKNGHISYSHRLATFRGMCGILCTALDVFRLSGNPSCRLQASTTDWTTSIYFTKHVFGKRWRLSWSWSTRSGTN
jgi:hypothetical protein